MLWIKSLHIIFVTAWFAGLFYLPRLFVNYAEVVDNTIQQRLALMAQRLFRFMSLLAVCALGFGFWLMLAYGFSGAWLHAKLGLVFILALYHGYCGKLTYDLALRVNRHSACWFRWFNEIPVIILVAMVILAVVKPF